VNGADEVHQAWARIANENGWRVVKGKKGHIVYLSPDKNIDPITVGNKDFGVRGIANAESLLRKNGLPIPKSSQKKKPTAFSLEQAKPTLSPEDKTNALRLVAAKQKPGTKLTLDQLAETLEIDDDDIKNELRDAVNEKFKDYFPSATPAEAKPEERKLNNREKRRRGIPSGGIGLGDSADKTPKSLVPDSLTKEAEAAGVSLDAILDDSDFDNDVEWSSNSWSFAKTKVQEAGDAVIIKKDKDGKTKVLMIRRKTAPFTDGYTLPGGLLDAGETLEQTADREMEEEVGISASQADSRRNLGEIKARDWDPRFVEGVRVGATRYDVPSDTKAVAASDAAGAEWVSVEDLANGKHRIGFGHAAWLSLAFEDDAELSRKFDILTRASRHRNQELIRRVNEKRKAAGEKLFSGLGSPNKHYIPEGTGPLGARKVQNLGFDLAKVITRNPGFFDKRTEEMFIHRSTHSSAETAKKFNMTEREFDDMLREATQKLEAKIRKDIAESMKKKGRKQGLTGSISTRVSGGDEVERAVRDMRLNDRQRNAVIDQTINMHDAFRTGEIYDTPIHAAIDSQRKELLDSIRITTAKGGLPMIVAKPHPLINPHLPIKREWATIELPEKEASARFIRELMENQGEEIKEDLSGLSKFYDHFSKILEKLKKDGGEAPIMEFRGGSGYTSYVQEYHLSLQDPYRASALLESFDLGVHDLFGHFGTGRAYDRHGEWANYLAMQDVIQHADIGLTAQEKDGLHRFWLREYGTFQLSKRGDMNDVPLGNSSITLVGPITRYTGPVENLLKILDSGENGLGGSRLSGAMSGKKIKDVSSSRLQQVAIADVENRLSLTNRRRKSGSKLSGAMSEGNNVFMDDSDIGAFVEDIKRRMPKDEWDGEEGEQIRGLAARLFSIDISEEERNNLLDDLMEWDYVYTYGLELEDDFDYASDNLNESDKDWKDYLDYLKDNDPNEFEFWKDYNPTEGFTQEDSQPSLFDEPWDRTVPRPLAGKKKSKRKLFGWRRNKDKPSRRINKIQFYGHKKMRDKQQEQLELFRKWKQESKWKDLHNAHYDWWAFPIDRGSAAYGDGYSVAGKNIDALKNDKQYMDNLREMASIYAEAMGWDLAKSDWLDSLEWDKGQDPWDQAYGARLYKVARSLQIFGLADEYKSFSQLVTSLRADDGLRRRIGRADYWDNPDVPFNNVTPGTRRHNRKMQAEFTLPKTSTKKRKPATGGMAAPPRGPRNPGRSPVTPSSEPRNRFMRELNVDDWYIFVDDLGEYLEKVKSRDVQLSTNDYRELMKAISIFSSLEAVPTDDNGISVNMSDDQVRQLRIVLKKITEAENKFFNIDEIYNALPTKERPKTMEAGGPNA
jgi:8-oxo-dGTP diphosphatase